MHGIRLGAAPRHIDGPSLVAAASGLMLLPGNASRLVRLHRLVALGMALPDNGAKLASPSAVRGVLKHEDFAAPSVLMQEDPYSEVLVQSVSFFGGPYLVSGGTGEHAVTDVESLIEAAFREKWMPEEIRGPARQLVQGLLTISDIVLRRANLSRATAPGRSPGTPVEVPGAAHLERLAEATFLSNSDLRKHGAWLPMVVDTFALDPGELSEPCGADLTDDRLYIKPFLRVKDGYRVALPLDLIVTVRFHLMRLAHKAAALGQLGERYRESAFRRFRRLLPQDSVPGLLERTDLMDRYLLECDKNRAVHVIVATDPLLDWDHEVWGSFETDATLRRLAELINPLGRRAYCTAEEIVHLVVIDSPGRSAFWGVPDVAGADPLLIARSDDLEVILHGESDPLVGLMLFAQAIHQRPGESMSTDILDEFSAYLHNEKSFYFSDGPAPDFISFQAGDGFFPRQKYCRETDRHGVVLPDGTAIVPAQRRYEKDAPGVLIVDPSSSYLGYVVEVGQATVFVTLEKGLVTAGYEPNLLECVAYWVHECAALTGREPSEPLTELVLKVESPDAWTGDRRVPAFGPAVRITGAGVRLTVQFTRAFPALLQEPSNAAERELADCLLRRLFGLGDAEVSATTDIVAPRGPKRMLTAFDEGGSPDMLADQLPRPWTGHPQVTAQLLDELGEWLRSPMGGQLAIGALEGPSRVDALNLAVKHLLDKLASAISAYESHGLLDFLVAQNEALMHDSRFAEIMLKPRLACFGEGSDTVEELVARRREIGIAQRANRFLIEFVAAEPPMGSRSVGVLDYLRLLSIAIEVAERATTSDFLHYGLADFEVSLLESGRLGVSRDEPVAAAMARYAENMGAKSVRDALRDASTHTGGGFDYVAFINRSESAVRAEFGFSLAELREVSGGLLDLAKPDRVTRIGPSKAVLEISSSRALPEGTVARVLEEIVLRERPSFLDIGQDAWPWRYNRNISYIRRPLVLQGDEFVFGFRSVLRLGPYWLENILSGRLQGRARTQEMRRLISEARGEISDLFACSVAERLRELGMPARTSVNKIGGRRIVDLSGNDIGDVDVLAVRTEEKMIVAVEAKDFEVARTPTEISNELQKLFVGNGRRKSAIDLHVRRIDWLREHLAEVLVDSGVTEGPEGWTVAGAVVTSEPLITPLVASSPFPVLALEDLCLGALGAADEHGLRRGRNKTRRR